MAFPRRNGLVTQLACVEAAADFFELFEGCNRGTGKRNGVGSFVEVRE